VTTAVSAVRLPRACGDRAGACVACRDRIIYVSFLANMVSFAVNGTVGVLSGSQAVMAMAVHSLSDSVVSGLIFMNAHGAASKAQRIRSKLREATVVFVAGFWVCTAGLTTLMAGPLHPGLFAIVVSALQLLVSFLLFRTADCASRRVKDDGIALCRKQNKTNLITAAISFTGVVLADLDFTHCDPLSAVLIGAVLIAGAAGPTLRALALTPAKAKRFALLPAVALSAGVAGYFAYDARCRTDVVLIPSTGTTLASPVENVLGRARYFVIVDRDKKIVKTIINGAYNYQGDVSMSLVATVASNEVDVVLANRIGQEVFSDLRAERVRMYYVTAGKTVGQAVDAFEHGWLHQANTPNVGKGYGRTNPRWLSPW
jgi:predicted Fe-Mo cluster-binding NifX family protein